MIVEERRQKLLETISRKGYASLAELVVSIGVSESTIRRDLEYLDEIGAVRRTHGGAMSVGEAGSLPAFDDAKSQHIREKRLIAQKMAALIRDGETVLLDGGSTTYEVAKRLVGRSLQVVTNSLPIANLLASCRDIDLVMIGGYVYPKTGVAVGPIAQQAMRDLHADRLVMSVSGLTQRGLFNGNLLLVETERAMMSAAKETNVVADNGKFGRQALAFLDDWSGIHRVVVDAGVSREQLELVGPNVEVAIADEPANGSAALVAGAMVSPTLQTQESP